MDPDRETALGDPEQLAADREQLEIVDRALSELKPDEREIVRLTLVDGLKPGQIAARTGCTSEVVRKRKSRAFERLRRAIQDRSRTPRSDHNEGEGR